MKYNLFDKSKKKAYSLNNIIGSAGYESGRVGAFAIAIMMFLTSADVLFRYLLNKPITGSFEITEYLMVICVSLTLSYCAVLGGHVKVDLVVSLFSARTQEVIQSVVNFIGLLFFLLVSWQSARQAINIKNSGTFSTVLHIPVFPFVWVLFFGSILFSVIFMRDLYKSLSLVIRRGDSTKLWVIFWSILAIGFCGIIFLGAVITLSYYAGDFRTVWHRNPTCTYVLRIRNWNSPWINWISWNGLPCKSKSLVYTFIYSPLFNNSII